MLLVIIGHCVEIGQGEVLDRTLRLISTSVTRALRPDKSVSRAFGSAHSCEQVLSFGDMLSQKFIRVRLINAI